VRNVATKVTATVVKWVYGVDHQLEQPVSKVGPGVEHGDAAVRGPATKTGLRSSADKDDKMERIELMFLHCTENPVYVFPEMTLCGLVSNFYIHVSVSNLYISRVSLPI
jgi:hypothetical protein